MNPDKRGTTKSFFLSSNKKPRSYQQQTESNIVPSSLSSSSSLPSSESQIPLHSSSLYSGDASTCGLFMTFHHLLSQLQSQ
jgi:hypothetical protein